MRADHQTSRQMVAPMVAITLVSCAMAGSGPAWAQAGRPEVTFEERAVIQEIPGSGAQDSAIEVEQHEMSSPDQGGHALEPMDHSPHHPMRDHPAGHRQIAPFIHPGPIYADPIYADPIYAGPIYPGSMYPSQAIGAPIYFPQGSYTAGAMPYPGGFEHDRMARDEWLEECRARHDDRGGRRDVPDECAAYLDQYDAQWQYMRYGYGYGPVMLVPIMVAVQQRAVVREYVTEEWVDEEVMVKIPGKEIIRAAPAPRPVKTVPVKTKSVNPVKSGKGR